MRRSIGALVGIFMALLITMTAAAQPVDLRVPHMMARTNEVVKIPIFVENLDKATSIEITLQYDNWVLDWDNRWGPGDLGEGMFTATVTPVPFDELKINLQSTEQVSGSGKLIELDFWVWCDIGKPISIQLVDVVINGVEVDPQNLSNGIFQVGVGLSGRVAYFMENRPIEGVALDFVGDSQSFSGISTEDGTFSMTIPRGSYQIDATKTDEINGLTAYDASLIMRAASGLLSLTDAQKEAADVNRDGRVDQADAQLLLDILTGKKSGPSPEEPLWVFLPQRTDYSINYNVSNLEVTGVLVGDVSGNWSEDETREDSVKFFLDSVSGEIGEEATIPLNVETGGKHLYAAELTVSFDHNKLQLLSIEPGDMAGGSLLSANTSQPGQVRIALANDNPVRDSGRLVEMHVRHLGDSEETINLQLTDARFNEAVTNNLMGGSVTAVPHPSLILDHGRIATATLVKDAAQVLWGDPYLSRSVEGETGVYLAFPDLIGEGAHQISSDARIVSAMLFWKFDTREDDEELPDKEMGVLLRRVADPDDLGAPAVTNRSGLKTGLSYVRRDDRVGAEVPWTLTLESDGIESALEAEDEVYVWLNPAVVKDRWVVSELKDIVLSWLDGSADNQGVYIQPDEGWQPGDRLVLKDLRLVVFYTSEASTQLDQVEISLIEHDEGKAAFSWNSPPGAQGVRVTKSQGVALVGPYDPNGEIFGAFTLSSFNDSEVESGELYYYGLMPYDINNNYGPIIVQPIIPGTLPPPEIDVAPGDASAKVSWGPVGDADGYAIYRRGPEDRRFIRQHEGVFNGTVWTDRSVKPEEVYEYYVVSVNSYGEGLASSIQSVEIVGIQDFPAAPTNLEGEALSPHSIRLTWEDNSDNELDFLVRRLGGGEWKLVGSVPANTTEYVVLGLEPGTYEFNVWARNTRGDTPAGASIIVSTLPGPALPANVQWQQVSPGSIDVSWDPPGSDVTDVRVVLYDKAGVEIERLTQSPFIGTVRFNRLEAGREYVVEVVFKNASGESAARIEHVVTTDYLFRGPGM